MFPEFIPIEFEGVSIITAVVFVFLFAGWRVYYLWDVREHTRIDNELCDKIEVTNDKVDLLFEKMDETNRNIASMNTNIAAISEAVDWIKKYMEQNTK